MTCDRCVELEARIEALLDELHDLKLARADGWSVRQAEARQQHPANRAHLPVGVPEGTCDWGGCDAIAERWRWSEDVASWLPVCWTHADLKRNRDWCDPNGIPRPKLTVVR